MDKANNFAHNLALNMRSVPVITHASNTTFIKNSAYPNHTAIANWANYVPTAPAIALQVIA
jgi:hypothetical protein